MPGRCENNNNSRYLLSNMLDFDTQNELLKENISLTKALEVAIHT